MASKYEYYTIGADTYGEIFASRWQAQTFTPSTNHRITSVKLKLGRAVKPTGIPGTVTVGIRATDVDGHPTGEDLCSGTIDGNTLVWGEDGEEWYEITLGDGYDLSADTKYAIVVRAPDGDASNYVSWAAKCAGGYANGNAENSGDDGTTWSAGITGCPNADFMFEEWGGPPVTAPTVIAKPATSVEVTTARSNGEVTDNGGENPTVHIYWGTSDGETTPGNWDHDENLGVKAVGTFYKDISGLTRGTKYYYRCYAENSGGSAWSNAVEFTTLLEKPVAAANAATGVGVSAATLNGTVTDDGGEDCQYRFRYKKAGGDYAYTVWTGAKATGETFSEGVSGLDASSTYYFNAQVKNSQFESDWSAERTFNTGAVVVAPTGTTDPATLVADIEATLNGKVTGDGGEACEVRFQYYTGVGDWTDNETVWQPGKLTNDTFSQRISGLTPNTEYHFRAQIKNSDSTASGADRTFTTEYFPTPFLRRVLRDVFGSGADITAGNPLQVYDPKVFAQIDKLAGETPAEDSVTKNWNTAVDSPDGAGGLLVNLGTAATRKKLHSLLLDASALTDGAIIHVKLFIKINGTQRKVYDETFTIAVDPDGLWIVNGTVGLHDVLSVAVYSDTGESKAIGYTAMPEAM